MRQGLRGFVHGMIAGLILLACAGAFAAEPIPQCPYNDPTDNCNYVARQDCWFEWELDNYTVDLQHHVNHTDGQTDCQYTCFVWGLPIDGEGSCQNGGGINPDACHEGFLDCNLCPSEPICIAVCTLNPLLPWC